MTNVHHTTGSEGPFFHEVTVIEGTARRRRWTVEEKARIVAESLDPVVSVSAVARRHGLNPNQLFTWRRQLRGRAEAWAAAGVDVVDGDVRGGAAASERIEIVLGPATVRVSADVEMSALRRVLTVVRSLG